MVLVTYCGIDQHAVVVKCNYTLACIQQGHEG